MKKIYTILTFMLLCNFVKAQNAINYNIDLRSGELIMFGGLGVSPERMFYRINDNSGNTPPSIFDDLVDGGDLIYRWPGGATSNFYHFNEGKARGYGLSRYEVDYIPDPMNCNFSGTTDYCILKDTLASRNYIYDMLDFAAKYKQRTGKPLKIMWIPNFLTFFVHDKYSLHLIDNLTSITQVNQLLTEGKISEGFRNRLKENLDVFDILHNSSDIKIVGVELGNELYYHRAVTGIPYDATNGLPALLFESYKQRLSDTVRNNVSGWKSLAKFYTSVIKTKDASLKYGVPVAVIPHTGKQPNSNLLLNEAIRDSIMPYADAVIHHFYFKVSGPSTKPSDIELPENTTNYEAVKVNADDFIHRIIPKVDSQYNVFFKLERDNKTMWMTEFNTDNGVFDGYLAQWMHTYFHAYFIFETTLSFLDNKNHPLVDNAYLHAWLDAYNNIGGYGAYAITIDSATNNISKTYRSSYLALKLLSDFIPLNLRKTNFTVSNSLNLANKDLLLRSYISTPNPADPYDLGTLYLIYSNKSGIAANIDLKNGLTYTNGPVPADEIIRKDAFAKYVTAEHLYSQNGPTLFDNSYTKEEVFLKNESGLNPEGSFIIPPFALGYVAIPLQRQRSTVVNTTESNKLSIFPNPSSGNIFIKGGDTALFAGFSKEKISITDMLGRKYEVKVLQYDNGFLELNIQHLPKGVYNISYKGANQTASGNLVVQ